MSWVSSSLERTTGNGKEMQKLFAGGAGSPSAMFDGTETAALPI